MGRLRFIIIAYSTLPSIIWLHFISSWQSNQLGVELRAEIGGSCDLLDGLRKFQYLEPPPVIHLG